MYYYSKAVVGDIKVFSACGKQRKVEYCSVLHDRREEAPHIRKHPTLNIKILSAMEDASRYLVSHQALVPFTYHGCAEETWMTNKKHNLPREKCAL